MARAVLGEQAVEPQSHDQNNFSRRMTYEDIDLPPSIPLADAAQFVEDFADAQGLRVSLRATLAQYPGSIHWHLKRGKEPGTLEVTLLNRERRFLLSVRANRQGPWTEDALMTLHLQLTHIASSRPG